jgi:hypothetical protein
VKKLIWIAAATLVLSGCGLLSDSDDEASDGTIVLPTAPDDGASGLVVDDTTLPPASPLAGQPAQSADGGQGGLTPQPSDPSGGDGGDGGETMATGEDDGTQSETAAGESTESTAVEDDVDALPRTGTSLVLTLVGTALLALGLTAVSTGKHLWLKAQLTNAFRIEPLGSTFRVERRRRR